MSNFRKNALASLLVAALPAIAWSGQVDINKADAKTLARELVGVGKAKAEAIVEYRDSHGPFRSPEDLALIKGIGIKIVEDNRGAITVSGTEQDRSVEDGPAEVETEN